MIIPKLPLMKPSDQIQLTDADKARYEKRITEIDLNNIPMVVKSIPVECTIGIAGRKCNTKKTYFVRIGILFGRTG